MPVNQMWFSEIYAVHYRSVSYCSNATSLTLINLHATIARMTSQWITLAKNTDNWREVVINMKTRMWANAQREGRPAEHRWRPLFNATKFS